MLRFLPLYRPVSRILVSFFGSFDPPSVGERPHPELLFADLPEPREAVRLDDQEEDDESANDHEAQVLYGGRMDGDAERPEQGRQDKAQPDRHDVDEGSAEKGADQASEPADD